MIPWEISKAILHWGYRWRPKGRQRVNAIEQQLVWYSSRAEQTLGWSYTALTAANSESLHVSIRKNTAHYITDYQENSWMRLWTAWLPWIAGKQQILQERRLLAESGVMLRRELLPGHHPKDWPKSSYLVVSAVSSILREPAYSLWMKKGDW